MSDHHFSNSGSAPPRGILKNRDGNSSSRFSGGPPPEMAPGDPRLNHRNSSGGGGNGETTNWMNVMQSGGGGLGAPGVNPSPAVVDGRLERSLNLKMNEFIARKKDLLYKPLTADEMPLAEVKGFQHNSEDHYGLVPSLDHYLHVDGPEIRSYFFQNLQVGDILIASVYTKNNSGINLKLLSTDGGKHIVLEDLGIKAFCPASHTVPPREKNEYEIGDTVRVEVLEVSADSEKLVCGMKGVTLSPEMQHTFHLGKISRHDFPRQFTLATNDSDSRYRRSYEDMLTRSSGFQNPTNIGHLASTMGILSNRNSLMVGLRNEFPVKEGAAYLRRIQNGKWAHGNVADGIKYFKLGKFTEAFQCLNKALSIDAENVEGLVARGALYANNGGFEKAIEDFEAALKFNPNHYNARKYLAETLVALGKQQETAAKLEDAVSSYSKCLAVKQDHKEARDALLSLFDRTNKLDLAKLAPPAALKAAELKERLKIILQTEMRMNLDGGKIGGKDKKSKRKKGRKSSASDDDSSTSSTSESESDSDSSDDSDKGKKRKKSKKSKKKKSKKSKKSREEARPMSLSPFSKRLVDPRGQGVSGSGLSGFNESSFSEWGQQLGLSQQQAVHTVHDSDDESKRSSKKSKKRSKKKDKRKKRRRNSSSSSESDSDDSARIKDKRKSSKPSSANTSLNLGGNISSVIPDLGDLEAKLSAYYSKIEHEKLEPIIPPEAVKITVERNNRGGWEQSRDAYNEPVRKVEMKSNADLKHDLYNSGGWHDGGKGGKKIELRTDDYGNYIQPENIVRTVLNPTSEPTSSEPKPIKFEIKFKANAVQPQSENEQGSKWRPLGSAPSPAEDDDPKTASPAKPAIRNPFEVQKFDNDNNKDRNYRGRRSISPRRGGHRRGGRSHSRSSRSSSSYSRSRSRSPRRSRSRSPRSRNTNRYRGDRRGGYDRDNYDRRGDRDRGRGGVRFFRGFNTNRGGGSRRPYVPRGRGRRDYRPNGPRDSKFRNRFSHSPSRSRSPRDRRDRRSNSRSKSRSRSVERTDARRPSVEVEKKNNNDEVSWEDNSHADEVSEIQIGGLTTTKASDVEELLDKRNAEKKEELRKSNPEFFRK